MRVGVASELTWKKAVSSNVMILTRILIETASERSVAESCDESFVSCDEVCSPNPNPNPNPNPTPTPNPDPIPNVTFVSCDEVHHTRIA